MISSVLFVMALGGGAVMAPTLTRSFLHDQSTAMHAEPENTTTSSLFDLNESQTVVTFFAPMMEPEWDGVTAIQQELGGYELLGDGWDGSVAVSPDPKRIALAQELLEYLPGGVSFPKPMLGSDGEIGLYWKNSRGFADIVVNDDGSCSFYLKESGDEGQEVFVESIPVSDSMRADLARLLKPLSRA